MILFARIIIVFIAFYYYMLWVEPTYNNNIDFGKYPKWLIRLFFIVPFSYFVYVLIKKLEKKEL